MEGETMTYVLAILATIGGMGASVMLLVLLVASAPNSKPEMLAQIKGWMLAIAIVTAASVVSAVWLMVVGRPWLAAGAGGFPMLFNAVSFMIMLRTMN
jgi:hypothetical protein